MTNRFKRFISFISKFSCQFNELEDKPELVNESPHEGGWLVKISVADASELEGLLTSSAYADFVEQESK